MRSRNTSPRFELRHLEHLVALAEHGTQRAAADALHLSQSALTKSIAALEDALGTELFDRSRRHLVPNALHPKILARAHALLRAAEDLHREAALFREGHLAEVQIGVGPVVALGRLPEVLVRFRALHPEVRVVVRVGSTIELIPALLEGGLHLVVADYAPGETDAEELSVEPLGEDPIGAAVRRRHPLLRVRRPSFDRLASYPRAAATPPPRIARFVEQVMGIERATVDVRCDNYEVLASLAEASDTIVLGPRSVLERYVAARRLQMLDVTYPSPASVPGVLTVHGRPLPPVVRALADVFLGRRPRDAS